MAMFLLFIVAIAEEVSAHIMCKTHQQHMAHIPCLRSTTSHQIFNSLHDRPAACGEWRRAGIYCHVHTFILGEVRKRGKIVS